MWALTLTFAITKEIDPSSHKVHTQNDNPIAIWKDKKLSGGNIIMNL